MLKRVSVGIAIVLAAFLGSALFPHCQRGAAERGSRGIDGTGDVAGRGRRHERRHRERQRSLGSNITAVSVISDGKGTLQRFPASRG